MFKALLLTRDDPAQPVTPNFVELGDDALPRTGHRDVLVEVAYSSLNFKDGLAIAAGRREGRANVVRSYPMVPGIDFCGQVLESDDSRYRPGEWVVLNGWGVGESHWGGMAGHARVSGDWLIPLPQSLSPLQSMAVGTAGYTAMLCIQALIDHGIKPADGEILVTGAAGGVGTVALLMLKALGYTAIASTGRLDEADFLKSLGAADVIDRSSLSAPGKPLQKERWAGVVDSVGSHTLANACAQTRSFGAVAACGLAQGMDFPATVAPFILRGVALYGINSVTQPREARIRAWGALAESLPAGALEPITELVDLEDIVPYAEKILDGQVRGRVVVRINY